MEYAENIIKLTGMQWNELIQMRPCDINCNQKPWEYSVPGTNRVIMIGYAAQTILGPLLENVVDPEKPLFTAGQGT